MPRHDRQDPALRACIQTWRRLGLTRDDISSMLDELQPHVESAAAQGRPVSAVIGDNPACFAREWAEARQDLTATWRPLGMAGLAVAAIALAATLQFAGVPLGLDPGPGVARFTLIAAAIGAAITAAGAWRVSRITTPIVRWCSLALVILAAITSIGIIDRALASRLDPTDTPTLVTAAQEPASEIEQHDPASPLVTSWPAIGAGGIVGVLATTGVVVGLVAWTAAPVITRRFHIAGVA